MLAPDDAKWLSIQGGYRIPFDPRPDLRKIETSPRNNVLWDELFQELFHQGDVGPSSYAAVPRLVAIIIRERLCQWQPISAVLGIELARHSPQNPPLPEWVEPEYAEAIEALARYCLSALSTETQPLVVRVMLAAIAVSKNALPSARLLLDYTDEELTALLDQT